METITVAITGGHITPAMALIDELHKTYPTWKVVLFGREEAMEGSKFASIEKSVAEEKGVEFYPVRTGRLTRDFSLQTLLSLFKVPGAIYQSIHYLLHIKPNIVVTFGGYIGVPVAMAAKVLNIPVVLHEQTSVMGLANRLISKIAAKILVTYPNTIGISDDQSLVVGLPLRKELFASPQKPSFTIPSGKPILIITGGSTGSMRINTVVLQALPELLKKYVVIHQVGPVSYQEAQKVKEALAKDVVSSYVCAEYIPAADYSWLLNHGHILIGRSGANTTAECMALGVVGIFIPLPISAAGEQYANAKRLVDIGSGYILDQKILTSDTLITTIKTVEQSYAKRKASAARFAQSQVRSGARRMCEEIAKIVIHP